MEECTDIVAKPLNKTGSCSAVSCLHSCANSEHVWHTRLPARRKFEVLIEMAAMALMHWRRRDSLRRAAGIEETLIDKTPTRATNHMIIVDGLMLRAGGIPVCEFLLNIHSDSAIRAAVEAQWAETEHSMVGFKLKQLQQASAYEA